MPDGYTQQDMQLVAEATQQHHIESGRTDASGNSPCVCDRWWDSSDGADWDEHMAEVALGALAGAGRLLPAADHEEWAVELFPAEENGGRPYIVRTEDGSEEAARFVVAGGLGKPIRRRVGPWVPAPDQPAVDPLTSDQVVALFDGLEKHFDLKPPAVPEEGR